VLVPFILPKWPLFSLPPTWDGKVAWGGSDTRAIEESNKKTALGDAYNKWAATDLADPTGGKAFLNNDLKGNMAWAIEAGSNYYTLTYSPTSQDWNGQYRRIQLQLARQGLTLAYRRGYYATDPNAPGQFSQQKTVISQPILHSALRSAMVRGSPEPAEIRFEMSVRPSIADAELALAPGEPKGEGSLSALHHPLHRPPARHSMSGRSGRCEYLHCGICSVRLRCRRRSHQYAEQ
jgi:hypothetical protein